MISLEHRQNKLIPHLTSFKSNNDVLIILLQSINPSNITTNYFNGFNLHVMVTVYL